MTVQLTDEQLETILERIRQARNFDFRNYKRSTLRRRMERRMGERRCEDYASYLTILDHDSREFDQLISLMLIKVTSFFRDAPTWEYLGERIIPELLQRHQNELRIWSAGCATGEEAYSLAMIVAEGLGPALGEIDVKIFGTDADENAIAYARRGQYTDQQVEDVGEERLARWFHKSSEGWQINKEIRRFVVFGTNNLISDAPISRLDLLVCRNVFIYFDSEVQKRVLSRFNYALRHDGVLVLGKSELIPFAAKIFESVDLQRRIYRKGNTDAALTAERLIGLLEQQDVAIASKQSGLEMNALGQFHRDMLNSVRNPIIVTTLDGSVSLWNAAAARLWKRPESEVLNRKITALGLTGLSGDLLIEKTAAVRSGRSELEVGQGALEPGSDGNSVWLNIEVTPVKNAAGEVYSLLYYITDRSSARRVEAELHDVTESRNKAISELQTANEELQSSNEELETTNEELQSANEELQTTNEELQSTNEELETTNEELQSTNAELDATNRELAHRTDELNLVTFYHRAIIRSLSAAVVVVDPQGRITLWNLAAERLLGFTEREAMGHLLWALRIPGLHRQSITRIRRSLSRKLSTRIANAPMSRDGKGHLSIAATPLIDGDKDLGAVIIFDENHEPAESGENASDGRTRRTPRR